MKDYYDTDYERLSQIDDPLFIDKRKNFTMKLGLDQPTSFLTIPRGAAEEKCLKRLNAHKGIIEKVDVVGDRSYYSDLDPEARQRRERYDQEIKNLLKAPPENLFVVFVDDCGLLHEPINGHHDEWNVLSNWRWDDPKCQEVWDRLKIAWPDAVKRIQDNGPIPPPVRTEFKVHPQYKKDIEDILGEKKKFDPQQDKKVHKALAERYATLAAKKMMELYGGIQPVEFTRTRIKKSDEYYLRVDFCDYDPWDAMYEFLAKHCEIGKRGVSGTTRMPIAKFDVSQDPDFEHSQQKVYEIRVKYYDSHAGGW